jgi:small subunit ribosomal protein S4
MLKGRKCFDPKCPVQKRQYAPGEHGQSRKKPSEYGLQLREKQKAKRIYGVLEAQFRRYFETASKRKGVTGDVLLQMLERRMDNVVYKMGLATSRAEARQLVRHGHFTVNGHKVNIPSYLVREGDAVEVVQSSKSAPRMKELAEFAQARTPPVWLEYDAQNLKARVVRLPQREEIDIPVQERMIVELYSK